MAVLIADPFLERQLIADRQRWGGDRFDEVWEGVYFMPPLPNDEHQEIQARFVSALTEALGWESPAKIRAGVNLSDRDKGWEKNFRCPDVVVFLPGNPAINHGAHWQGGPDFLAEIVSEADRAIDKLGFYADIGVREVLFIERNPWSLALYQRASSSTVLTLTATITAAAGTKLHSAVLPLTFSLVPGGLRPRIEALLTSNDAPGPRAVLVDLNDD